MFNWLTSKKEKAEFFSIPQYVITDRGFLTVDKIKKGYKIIGNDGVVNSVEQIEKNIQHGTFYVIDKSLVLYENQSVVLASGAVVHAKMLKRGDALLHRDGTTVQIQIIKKLKGNYYFHKLKIGGDHTYYINDILVHNASRYWVAGTGSWDLTTAHWGSASGTVDNASVPTLSDDVYFDSGSNATAYTVTITSTNNANCANLSIGAPASGKITLAGTLASAYGIQIYGDLSMPGGSAGITATYGGYMNFRATNTGHTVSTNGVSLAALPRFRGEGGGWTLSDNFTTSYNFVHTAGSLNTNGMTVTSSRFVSGNDIDNPSSLRSLTLGASTINTGQWSILMPQYLTSCSMTSSTINQTPFSQLFDGGNQTYNIVTLVGGSSTKITGSNTFTTLTYNGSSDFVNVLTLSGNQTITGLLTITGTSAVNRIFVSSDITGVQRTLSAGSISVNAADFRDIAGVGAASWDMSGASLFSGNCGGNAMQALGDAAFTTAADQHWLNSSSSSWSIASNWTSRVPLPQDNVFMDRAFGTSQTVTANMPRLGKTIDWSGATWTTTVWFSLNPSAQIYGSLILKSGMTTLGSSNTMTFAGRGNYTITTAGVTHVYSVTVDMPGYTLSLDDNYIAGSNSTLTLSQGTFTANNHDVTTFNFVSTGSFVRTLYLGTGTWTLLGTAWQISTSLASNITLYCSTSTIKFTYTSSSSQSFQGGGLAYNIVWFAKGSGTGAVSIYQGSFAELKDTGTAAHTVSFLNDYLTVVGALTISGAAGALITLNSFTSGRRAYLSRVSGTNTSDYLILKDIQVAGGATWVAGANSTFSSNTAGWSTQPTTPQRYWVTGGNGNWSSTTNWSTSNGGASGASVPTGDVDVFFTSLSGSGNSIIDVSQSVHSLDFNGFTGTLSGTIQFVIYGSIRLSSSMTMSHTGAMLIYHSLESKTITCATKSFAGAITFGNVGCNGAYFTDVWSFQDSFSSISASGIVLASGTLDANDQNVSLAKFTSTGSTLRTLYMGAGTWSLTSTSTVWNIATSLSSNITVNSETSTIKITDTSASGKYMNGGGKTYYDFWNATYPSSIGAIITDNNTFNDIKIDPGAYQAFQDGSTQLISSLTAIGDASHRISLTNNDYGAPFVLSKTSDSVIVEYCDISFSTVQGGASWVAQHSIDNGDNTGWSFVAQTAQTLSLQYEISHITTSSITKSSRYAITVTNSATKSLRYAIDRVTSALTKLLKYTLKTTLTAISKTTRYSIRVTHAAFTKPLRYAIRPSSALARGLHYLLRKNVSLMKSLSYDVKITRPVVTKTLQYSTRLTHALTSSVSYVINTKSFSRESSSSLATYDASLSTEYSHQEIIDVSEKDGIVVNVTTLSPGVYATHLFKVKFASSTYRVDIRWSGKSTMPATSSVVVLQVYNRTTSSWETIDTNSTASAGDTFDLHGSIETNLSDYYDSNSWIAARVYQQQ